MDSKTFFEFHNYSYPKYPHSIKAKFLFEVDTIQIPNTNAFLNITENTWVFFDSNNENLFQMTMDQFNDIYIASDKKAQKYYEFVIDSNNNDYNPHAISTDELIENIMEDLIEKPVMLSFKGKLSLVWDLILNKKIFISKYN